MTTGYFFASWAVVTFGLTVRARTATVCGASASVSARTIARRSGRRSTVTPSCPVTGSSEVGEKSMLASRAGRSKPSPTCATKCATASLE